ncbi:MAG: hypothetical protein Q9222_006262 [Ikaeria aurantiellina]
MFLLSPFSLALPLLSACVADVPPGEADIALVLGDTATLPSNLTWEPVDLAVPGQNPNVLQVACDVRFGNGLDARACFDAWHYAPRGTQQETWITRFSGGLPPPALRGAVQLPLVILNNATSCVLAPAIAGAVTIAHASAFNVSEAARKIIQMCVIPRRLGGIARNIGGDNRLTASVRKNNQPHPQCTSPIRATTGSCAYILDEMKKEWTDEEFAPASMRTPVTTVALPLTLRSPDGMCQMVIDIGPTQMVVTSSFLQVWYAAELVVAGCVRGARKGGQASVKGTFGVLKRPTDALKITIMDEPAQIALPGVINETAQDSWSGATA